MRVGFIGAGAVTRTFGRHLIIAGHTLVVSNSRGPETLVVFVAELGPNAIAGTKQQAAECDVVILATHWVSAADALKGTRGDECAPWACSLPPELRITRMPLTGRCARSGARKIGSEKRGSRQVSRRTRMRLSGTNP